MSAPGRVGQSAVRAPSASYLAGSVDDFVIRLSVPGGVVQDCTIEQGRRLHDELGQAVELAERARRRNGERGWRR